MLAIINTAAIVYKGTIPEDCWHDPYMSPEQLAAELAAGVIFYGCDLGGALTGIMGFQRVRDVHLIRHAYVLPQYQGRGIGSALIRRLEVDGTGRILIGTWSAASWAIAFYEGHGYQLALPEDKGPLLKTYWTVSDRQIEASVVLAKPAVESRAGEPEARAEA